MPQEIYIPLILLGALRLLFGAGLAVAGKIFAVQVDERIEKIEELLPGANCGACGFPGCSGFADAVVAGKASPALCAAVSSADRLKIFEILGQEAEEKAPEIAVIRCTGDISPERHKFEYIGETDCAEAMLLAEGPNPCRFGCLGMGSCAAACPFGAIRIVEGKPPEIIEEKCVACGKCVETCPKNLITIMPRDRDVLVLCMSHLKGKEVKDACKTGCIGCGLCAKKCPEQAITMVDNLPVIDYEKCTSCGTCSEVCPQKTILFTGKKPEPAASEA